MNITIYRGSREIGGTCIELASKNSTILLDMGLPLQKDSEAINLDALKPDAIIISHPHLDHYGLIEGVSSDMPIYIGKLGRELIDATRIFLGKGQFEKNFQYFESWKPFVVGDFTITPFLVDHSACDAYAFLIEAEGKRLFYSGDFRGHGRKKILFENIIKDPPKNIDLLFMEGTMLERSNDEFPNEDNVEEVIYETIKGQENITFLISSSQNIDRIVSAFRACKKAKKTLVIDVYTAWVLDRLKMVSKSVPNMEWEEVKVYLTNSQYQKLKANPAIFGDFQAKMFKERVKGEVLMGNPSAYMFLGKMSSFPIINKYKKLGKANVIYSQWMGYLKDPDFPFYGSRQMAGFQDDPMINFVYAHTSGHAILEDLKRFAMALNPTHLVPVHTNHPDEYIQHFGNVLELTDKQVFAV